MKVILKSDVEKLGSAGDVVTVKNGYGRNFLIPRGVAVLATKSNIKHYEEITRQSSHKLSKVKDDATALAAKLEGAEFVVSAKVGEENRIFGTVTSQQIANLLAERGLEVDRRKIDLHEEIRTLGVFAASVNLHQDVIAQIKIKVVEEESE